MMGDWECVTPVARGRETKGLDGGRQNREQKMQIYTAVLLLWFPYSKVAVRRIVLTSSKFSSARKI